MKPILLILTSVLFSIVLPGQDQIILMDSSKIDGQILMKSANQIKYKSYRTLEIEFVDIDTIAGFVYQGETYYLSENSNSSRALIKEYTYHSAKNTFYGEALCSTLSYSINYDRLIFQKGALKNSLYLGVAIMERYGILYPCFVIGDMVYIGKGSNHVEFGMGLNYLERVTETYPSNIEHTKALILNTKIGYRYKRPEGRFFFNIGFVPMIALTVFQDAYDDDGSSTYEGILPFGAIGFGYTLVKRN